MSTLKSKGWKVDLAVDNRLLSVKPEYTIFKSGNDISLQSVGSNTYNNSSITWNILPSAATWIDRRMLLKFEGRFTLNNSSGVIPPGWTGCVLPSSVDASLSGIDGLRWMPVQSQCSNISLQINNGTITVEPSLFLEACSRYGWDQLYENTWMSVGSVSMHDSCQTYAQSYQTNRNPLGSLLSNPIQCPRGNAQYTVVSNTPTQAVIDCVWYEPFFAVSPMLAPDQFASGLWDINKINLTFNIQNAMSTAWSHDAVNGAPIDSISFSWNSAPTLTLTQISNIGGTLERNVDKILPYHEIQVFQNDGVSNLSASASYTQTLKTVRLDGTPSKIYLFCKKQLNNFTFNDTDTYAYISNVSINFNTKTGLLANLPPEGLYQQCVNNGLKYSWAEFKSFQGSVVCIDFSTDISMEASNAVGMSVPTQISITLTYQNISPSPITYTIYQVVVYEGLLDYSYNQSQTFANILQPGDITKADIDSASKSRAAHMLLGSNFMGGTFKDSAKKVYHQALDLGKKYGPTVAKVAKKYAPDVLGVVSPRLGEAAKLLLGQGLTHDQVFKRLLKQGFKPSQIRAAGISGGKAKPKSRSLKVRGRGFDSDSHSEDDYDDYEGGQLIDSDDADDLLLDSSSHRLSLRDRY